MKKSLLSILGLAVALAFSMPVLGNAAATTTAPAAITTTAPAAAKPAAAKKTTKKACKATKTHKCPVKHKKAAKTAAPKKAY
jgi:hypothetical protein